MSWDICPRDSDTPGRRDSFCLGVEVLEILVALVCEIHSTILSWNKGPQDSGSPCSIDSFCFAVEALEILEPLLGDIHSVLE